MSNLIYRFGRSGRLLLSRLFSIKGALNQGAPKSLVSRSKGVGEMQTPINASKPRVQQ
jgi:hypothetical protein